MATIHIGGASATFVESRLAMPQLLNSGEKLDYLVFDCLAEGVMGMLGRQRDSGQPGYVVDFVEGQIAPWLPTLAERRIRVVANAGGADPEGCAAALRTACERAGVNLRIAAVTGDDLRERVDEFIDVDTRDMFDGTPLREKLDAADKVLSVHAYLGGFPVAAALAAGADIVVTGRIVDSATTLGALIHEFGWTEADYDLLAAGTLVGHLLECTTQVSGGTFTDWRDVPDWANIGFPIAACEADGTATIYKPQATGGLITPATVAEQMLYEVSDPQHYRVPDVTCDFTGVEMVATGENRVRISGARGIGRPHSLKGTINWDEGWRADGLMPVIGHDAAEKAHRLADELFSRMRTLARDKQLPPYTVMHHDVIGGTEAGATTAICRVVVDHPDQRGVALFARERSSLLTNTVVGLSMPMGGSIRPVSGIGGFWVPRDRVEVRVTLDGADVPFSQSTDGGEPDVPAPEGPPLPEDASPLHAVPLIKLAWVRSGDKGDLFNVGVIAREPEYAPYIWAALDPQAVGRHYATLLGSNAPYTVDKFALPGTHALNLVVQSSLQGGMHKAPMIDSAAKGMGQLLLDFPIPVSEALTRRLAPQPEPA